MMNNKCKDVSRSGTPWALVVLLILMIGAMGLVGCGCSYGAPSAVSVSPEVGCLDASAEGGCAHFTLLLINHCSEEVSLISTRQGPVTITPEQSMSLSPSEYGELIEDEESCLGKVAIPATLGQQSLVLEFSFPLVNRGAGGC